MKVTTSRIINAIVNDICVQKVQQVKEYADRECAEVRVGDVAEQEEMIWFKESDPFLEECLANKGIQTFYDNQRALTALWLKGILTKIARTVNSH
jgi:hypothetical protein